MQTNPKGRSFLSYRRTRVEEAALLIRAQHELGIPTWQDLHNLAAEHTDTALRATLADPATANALIWLTPDVAASPTITKTELPCIFERTVSGDDFFILPVAAGGLDYGDIKQVAGSYLGAHDLAQWNVLKYDADPICEVEARDVAVRVLHRRLRAIHTFLPPSEALRIGLYTRQVPAFSLDLALTINWSHCFVGRDVQGEAWPRLIAALKDISTAIAQECPGREIAFEGLPALPAAVALGVAFMATKAMPASWMQYTLGRPLQAWSAGAAPEDCGFKFSTTSHDVSGDDLAVLISVTGDVIPAFSASKSGLSKFRALVDVRAPGDFPHNLSNTGQAADLVARIIKEIRKARTQFQTRGVVHLFMAVPAGIAMMLGQGLNTLGRVQTYEHHPSGAVGEYRPAVLLQLE